MKHLKLWGVGMTVSLVCLLTSSRVSEAGTLTAGKSHIGTFEGSTTFTTGSSNGINPGLFIEVRDADGNLKQYTSEDGVITVENTKEGAYVTQAKLLGKTKYRDQDTGELLDEWEDGRNLTLESVQMPVLTTVGKNLFDGIMTSGQLRNDNVIDNSQTKMGYSELLHIEEELDIYCSYYTNSFYIIEKIYFYDENKNQIDAALRPTNVTSPKGTKYFRLSITTTDWDSAVIFDDIKDDFNIQVETGIQATPYEPYKSNILSTSEEVELRGIGDVRDELDLLTGEVTERVGEVVFDGSDDEVWNLWATYPEESAIFKISKTNALKIMIPFKNGQMVCDKFPTVSRNSLINIGATYPHAISFFGSEGEYIQLRVYKSLLKSVDVDGLRDYLANEPITVQYPLADESIKTVDLSSTYAFNLISDSVVQVKGEILPTIYSITVPSQPLTFAINPNAEAGQQFIAPEFEITNESPGPIQLELKAFEQVTNVLNDVLPDHYPDWTQLNKKQSKDIALALVPEASDGWLTLNEGPRYVANSANTILGEIRKDATVRFSFSARHGGVFEANLFPEYRLVFTFGF